MYYCMHTLIVHHNIIVGALCGVPAISPNAKLPLHDTERYITMYLESHLHCLLHHLDREYFLSYMYNSIYSGIGHTYMYNIYTLSYM